MTYKLQTDIIYYITSKQGVLFVEPGKKILTRKAESWLFKTGHRIVKTGQIRTGQKFELKLINTELWVKHPRIMSGSKYFKVLDSLPSNIYELIQSTDVINQEFQEKFELLLVYSERESVTGFFPYFSKPGSLSYEEAWEEFVRTTNIQRKKKTRTILAGHRYDTPELTLWCLGDVYVPNDTGASYTAKKAFVVTKSDCTTVSECFEKIKRVVKKSKISEIKSYYGYKETDLLIVDNVGLMTDSGSDLVPLSGNIHQFWGKWINECDCKCNTTFQNLMNLLWSTSGRDLDIYQTTEKPSVAPLLKKALIDYLINYIMINYEGVECWNHKLRIDLKDEDFIRETIEIFMYMWVGSRESYESHLKLIKDLGVDIESAILESREQFKKIDFSTLDSLLAYPKRFLSGPDKKIYERSLTFQEDQKDDGKAVRKLFNNDTVASTVIEMMKLAQENLGLVSEFFEYLGVYQYNKKSEPDINIRLTLKNIIDYMGGLDSMSETFKDVLAIEKFLELNISFKRNIEFL